MLNRSRRKKCVRNENGQSGSKGDGNQQSGRKLGKLESIRKKLKENDCFLGVIPHTKLANLTVTCSKFSVIVQFKSKLITFFVTRKKVIILDPSCTMVKSLIPNTLTQFLNSLVEKRKIIIAKVSKAVKTLTKLSLRFLAALYSGLTITDVVSLLNLTII